MASTATKNIMLSQQKVGQGDHTQAPTLPHTSVQNGTVTEIKVEVPGIDPSTIEVGFEDNLLQVHCEKGVLALPVDPTVDTSKIKADILWGLLTLLVPLPVPPAARNIKVSIHDAVPTKKPAVKAQTATLTEEE
jgi:HSP20 family molecular chaperone IbpA